jgi:diketogulonate reductase-like aldo/keto reductase
MRFRISLNTIRNIYKMALNVPSVKLNNGHHFPLVGLGTYKTNNNPEQLINAIKHAVSIGYRHFDLALCYENEDVIGRAFKEVFEESKGTLKREDFFIVDKLWNTYHSKEEVPKNLDRQLKDLGFDYVDLYLMHWPFAFKVTVLFIF